MAIQVFFSLWEDPRIISLQLISAMDEQYKYEYKYEKKKRDLSRYYDRKSSRISPQEEENYEKNRQGLRKDVKNLTKDSLETLRSTFKQLPLLKAEIKQRGTTNFYIDTEFRDGDLYVVVKIGTMILVETVPLPAINKLVIRIVEKARAYAQVGDESELTYPHLQDGGHFNNFVIEWVPKDSISWRRIEKIEMEQLIQTNERAQQKLSKKGKGDK